MMDAPIDGETPEEFCMRLAREVEDERRNLLSESLRASLIQQKIDYKRGSNA